MKVLLLQIPKHHCYEREFKASTNVVCEAFSICQIRDDNFYRCRFLNMIVVNETVSKKI